MKCVAIGDMFIPTKHFDSVLKTCTMFDEYVSIPWKENENRENSRDIVRQIELKGCDAFSVPQEIYKETEDAEVIFFHLCPIPGNLIRHGKKLKYLITARGGVENIDVLAAKESGVTIINCPSHNAVAVAEYTIALMLGEIRNVVRSGSALAQGIWRERFPNSEGIPELRDTCIGLVGFGTIGRLVAERLKSFGSTILIYDPFIMNADIEDLGYLPVSMDELLEKSDIVSLHGRIAAGEPPIIGPRELKKMKKTAYLINTARAALIDMEELHEALKKREIMGAALDVFSVEPLPKENPLLKLDNVTLTNHRGGDTANSYSRAPELLMEQFKEVIETGETKCMIK